MRCVTVLSGGADSVTLAYYLQKQHYDQHLVSFDYGQKNGIRELYCARKTARELGCKHSIIDLQEVGKLLTGCALTDDSVELKGGEAETKLGFVPNRNTIMLSIAYAIAVSEERELVTFGANKIIEGNCYPDCTENFINSASITMQTAVKGLANPLPKISAPFLEMGWRKRHIIKWGVENGVSYENTWTCLKRTTLACGTCGSCMTRLACFAWAGFKDPLFYEDRESWQRHIII